VLLLLLYWLLLLLVWLGVPRVGLACSLVSTNDLLLCCLQHVLHSVAGEAWLAPAARQQQVGGCTVSTDSQVFSAE
jgi:hypothetical protein